MAKEKKYKVVVIVKGMTDGKLEAKLDSLNEVFTFISEQVDFSYLENVYSYLKCGSVGGKNIFNLRGVDKSNPLHKDMEVSIEVWEL